MTGQTLVPAYVIQGSNKAKTAVCRCPLSYRGRGIGGQGYAVNSGYSDWFFSGCLGAGWSPQTDVARVAVVVSHGSRGGLQNLPHLREDGNCSVYHRSPVCSVQMEEDRPLHT